MRRPNVLMIMTDQHRPDHLGFGGNDIAAMIWEAIEAKVGG